MTVENVIRLTDETYEFIKGEAVHILRHYNIKCFPISGFEIATKIGVRLVPYSTFDNEKLEIAREVSLDGFSIVSYSSEIIYYNDIDCGYERQNWTLLHEIGHIVLDHASRTPLEAEIIEVEANFFAKYIVAPPAIVHLMKLDTLDEISNFFGVSCTMACHARNYYLKWLAHYRREKSLKDYEKELLDIFSSQYKEIQSAEVDYDEK